MTDYLCMQLIANARGVQLSECDWSKLNKQKSITKWDWEVQNGGEPHDIHMTLPSYIHNLPHKNGAFFYKNIVWTYTKMSKSPNIHSLHYSSLLVVQSISLDKCKILYPSLDYHLMIFKYWTGLTFQDESHLVRCILFFICWWVRFADIWAWCFLFWKVIDSISLI